MSARPTALIADDEPLLREALRGALAEAWPDLDIVAEAANGAEAVHAAREHQPRFAFLDIEMPVLNGLEAARAMNGLAHVVFVTAYDRYAVEAFERGAVDYVLKPARVDRLCETAARLRERGHASPAAFEALMDELARRVGPGAAPLQWLQASLGSTIRLISVDDVAYFQSDAKYTRVVTAQGEALVKTPLRELAAQLDARHFWQIHRGTIVNIRAIDSVAVDADGRRQVALRGHPERLDVSRTFAHLFKRS